jgi:hypothetical protein
MSLISETTDDFPYAMFESPRLLTASSIVEAPVLPTSHGGTGSTSAKTARVNINSLGFQPVKGDDDTYETWRYYGFGVAYYQTSGLLNGQPAQYGLLVNIAYPTNTTEVVQFWLSADGSIWTRARNNWNTWTRLC